MRNCLHMWSWLYNLMLLTCSLLHAGHNGTVDGQGSIWWNWYHNKTLNYTRPHLVELMNSTAVVISNLTFLNSPFWTIHPVYCRLVRSTEIGWRFSVLVNFKCFQCLVKKICKREVIMNYERVETSFLDEQPCFRSESHYPCSSQLTKHRWDRSR